MNGRKRLRVSSRSDLEVAAVGYCTSPLTKGIENLSEIRGVGMQFPMLRHSGSAALDLAYVAAGRLDGYWERGIKAWDVAAGILIIKEAGGFVSSIDDESNVVYSNQIVSGNQPIYNHLRKTLKETAKKAA